MTNVKKSALAGASAIALSLVALARGRLPAPSRRKNRKAEETQDVAAERLQAAFQR